MCKISICLISQKVSVITVCDDEMSSGTVDAYRSPFSTFSVRVRDICTFAGDESFIIKLVHVSPCVYSQGKSH